MITTRKGFTGTQAGMTQKQMAAFAAVLDASVRGEFHHGDCVGSDEQAHDIAHKLGYRIVVHPPTIGDKRAYKEGDIARAVAPYLTRNHDIVDDTTWLIAAPRGFKEELRSGTWATVRYARKLGKRVWVIWPDGKITKT